MIDKTIDVDGGFDPTQDARHFKLALPNFEEARQNIYLA